MRLPTGKKLLLVGFLSILLLGIPTTVFLLQQQQDNRSHAQKSTTLSFVPVSTESAPIQKKVGDTFPMEVNINPGVNSVSYIKMEIQYDPTKVATADANAFQANTTVFPTVVEGPTYAPGKITVTLSIGIDITKAITQPTRAATINFKALSTTATAPTLITYGNTTEVLSIGSTDQSSENVLSTTSPAYVAIAAADGTTPTDTPTPSTSVTPTTSPEPSTTTAPTLTPADTTTTPAPTSGTTTQNQSPVCSSLTIDRAASGVAPYAVTFTVNGSDADGTISKVTFNFGDGAIVDVVAGAGSGSISTQTSHSFTNAGTYQTSAVLTDNKGGISIPANCTTTITVTGGTASNGTTTGGTAANGGTQGTTQTTQTAQTPPSTVTGPGELFVGAGAIVGVLSLIGGIIFFTF